MEEIDGCQILRNSSIMPNVMFKLIVIGEASVGKSCIMMRAVKDEYKGNYDVTVGVESNTFMVKINETIVQLQIWDTAGTEKFRSMIRVFFAGSHGTFLVYDITRKDTFEAIDFWLSMLRDNTVPDIKIILVGNKKDKEAERQVPYEIGENYMKKNGLFAFVETSAKTGEGVSDMFVKIAKTMHSENPSGTISSSRASLKLKQAKSSKGGCC